MWPAQSVIGRVFVAAVAEDANVQHACLPVQAACAIPSGSGLETEAFLQLAEGVVKWAMVQAQQPVGRYTRLGWGECSVWRHAMEPWGAARLVTGVPCEEASSPGTAEGVHSTTKLPSRPIRYWAERERDQKSLPCIHAHALPACLLACPRLPV